MALQLGTARYQDEPKCQPDAFLADGPNLWRVLRTEVMPGVMPMRVWLENCGGGVIGPDGDAAYAIRWKTVIEVMRMTLIVPLTDDQMVAA